MRLEKDRLRKQKRTREASKTELDDIRAKDVARKKNNGESQEKRTMRLDKDRLRKQKRTREASKTELDDIRAKDVARKKNNAESQEKRTMRLEKDRLRKEKRTREASKTELDDIRAKDVARKKTMENLKRNAQCVLKKTGSANKREQEKLQRQNSMMFVLRMQQKKKRWRISRETHNAS
jgi:hypothetical protein